MLSDYKIAETCARLYDATDVGYKYLWDLKDVYAALFAVDDYDVLVFRGSMSVVDWLRDFSAVPVRAMPGTHLHNLGYLEDGFSQGMEETFEEVLPVLTDRPLIVTGHSLGAARAYIMTGLLVKAAPDRKPEACVVFGPPKPGFRELAEILSASGITVRGYRNRSDPVTYVPHLLGLYAHPGEILHLDVAAAETDDWGILRDHHLSLYMQGVQGK